MARSDDDSVAGPTHRYHRAPDPPSA